MGLFILRAYFYPPDSVVWTLFNQFLPVLTDYEPLLTVPQIFVMTVQWLAFS